MDSRTPLKDGAYIPDYETLRKIFWLHCRHTSVTYISRMTEMLEAFTKGFAEYVGRDSEPGSFADFLRVCYSDIADLQEGLARLRKADHNGFKLIRGAMSFRDPFTLRVAEYEFGPLGYNGYGNTHKALWCWIDKVIPMSGKIEGTLEGDFTYPLFDVSKFQFPKQIGGYPHPHDIFIKDGEDIPVTGVWQPKTLRGGCPNFFIQGEKAPKANLPILRIDKPAYYEKILDIHHPARSDFDVGQFSTVWQLVWEDDRWRNGREPSGEYEYIQGSDTELPKEPPVALRDPPKMP
jgi:Immunity protein 72